VIDKIGTLIKIIEKKRAYLKVKTVDKTRPYEHRLVCELVYRPSPKSQIRRNCFSKIKLELV
jgi:hypothetical protein